MEHTIHCPFEECPVLKRKIKIKYPYFKCGRCKLIFYTKALRSTYEENYFGKEYKKQYGKEYLDDKKNISKKMESRMHALRKFLPDFRGKRLLEMGSAAGFFLEIAQKSGFYPEGWEISKKMSKFANKNGIFTRTGDFHELFHEWKKKSQPFDIIAAFYFVEHISDPFLIWNIFDQMIHPKGFLLITLPSYFGPMYFFHRKKWLEEHPKDHFVDYSVKSLTKISKKFGFRLVYKTPDSLHPERFPLNYIGSLNLLYRIIQKKLAFSDTLYIILMKG